MGQINNPPESLQYSEPEAASASLKEITTELEHLKQNLIGQLSQEIEQLQTKKSRLQLEVEQLEFQRQEQIKQQQDLAKQIAPAIVQQLNSIIQQRLKHHHSGTEQLALNEHQNHTYGLISALDATLKNTFNTLQQDLRSYQSALSQQLGQMYSLEQQGEAILDALVTRLKDELTNEKSSELTENKLIKSPPKKFPKEVVSPPKILETEQQPVVKRHQLTKVRLGFLLVLFSSLALSFQNVLIRIILSPSEIFGVFETGGYISTSFANSLLILCLRMVVVVPLMLIIAHRLYPRTRQEMRKVSLFRDKGLFFSVAWCGFFLFLSSALIYLALGSLSPGIALTCFFVFPIVTLFLSWLFFGERPSPTRVFAALTVFVGVVLITVGKGGADNLSTLGIIYALGAGITFALHVLLIQFCTKKMHPVPFSVVNFIAILVFSALSMVILPLVGFPITIDPTMTSSIIISGGILGVITLISYLSNNIGISYIGAARASIFGATGPALTSLLAWGIIGEDLVGWQIAGMLVVTAGVMGLSLERLFKSPKRKK